MEVEHDRLTLVIVDTVDTAPDELERRQPEVAAAANRQVHAEQSSGADREFSES